MVVDPSLEIEAEHCSYAKFGEHFFEHAFTEQRILDAVSGLAGGKIEFGPIGAGPGRLAQVQASGVVGQAAVSPRATEEVSFVLLIPVELDLHIDLAVETHHFRADVEVSLVLTARAAEPLRVVIDVEAPTKENVSVHVEAANFRGRALDRIAGVEGEIRRFVAKYVAREIDKPHIRAARDIDVAARIDGAWKRTSPKRAADQK